MEWLVRTASLAPEVISDAAAAELVELAGDLRVPWGTREAAQAVLVPLTTAGRTGHGNGTSRHREPGRGPGTPGRAAPGRRRGRRSGRLRHREGRAFRRRARRGDRRPGCPRHEQVYPRSGRGRSRAAPAVRRAEPRGSLAGGRADARRRRGGSQPAHGTRRPGRPTPQAVGRRRTRHSGRSRPLPQYRRRGLPAPNRGDAGRGAPAGGGTGPLTRAARPRHRRPAQQRDQPHARARPAAPVRHRCPLAPRIGPPDLRGGEKRALRGGVFGPARRSRASRTGHQAPHRPARG